jgi:hypothetical protein
VITRHGEDVAIVLATKQYAEIIARQSSIVEFFTHSPLAGLDLEIERNRSGSRTIDP